MVEIYNGVVYNSYEDVEEDFKKDFSGFEFFLGEAGCYRSHLNIMKEFLETNNRYLIIFEDDFCFFPTALERLIGLVLALDMCRAPQRKPEIIHLATNLCILREKALDKNISLLMQRVRT